jgi:hypothetical protein
MLSLSYSMDIVITVLDNIHRPVFYLKQRFEDWILSPYSGRTYSVRSPVSQETATSSIYGTQLSRFQLNMETERSLWKAVF